jgi:glycosyltransferase involved in cell wall biosynthesis
LTILSVGYPLLPVGPDSGGGAEQILYLVERGLVQAGHRSVVVAAAGSNVSGELIETPAVTSAMTQEVRHAAQKAHLVAIDAVLGRYSIDLIHFHGLDFHTYVPSQRVPKLATLHLPVDWYPRCIFDSSGIHLNCVSQTQAASALPETKVPVVINGIHLSSYRPQDGHKDYLLWLGRICPEKAVDLALRVAHRVDMPMIVAGPIHSFREHEIYFADHVQPALDEKRRYVGPVGLDQKRALLAEARCLLIPSAVAETSSLVAMEAFASGTPVIAFRSGALPEIVDHGKTGFIVDSEDGMVEAVRRAGEISSTDCRRAAEVRFDSERMVRDYLDLYKAIAA